MEPCSLCLGNISKIFTVDNIRKTGLDGYVFDFSVGYNTIDVSDILDIYKHLRKSIYFIIKFQWINSQRV